MSARRNKVAVRPAPRPRTHFACVLFEFTPSVPEELPLSVGDVVEVLKRVDEFWLHGLLLHNGECGQFPKNFVKDIILPEHSANESLLYALDTFQAETDEDLPLIKGDVVVLERKIDDKWGTGRCGSRSRGMFPLNYTRVLIALAATSLENQQQTKDNHVGTEKQIEANVDGFGLARAVMDLTAQLDEELSFSVGDEITIIEVLDDGTWFKGRLGDDVGMFPASFVQLLFSMDDIKLPKKNSFSTPSSCTGSKTWKEDALEPVFYNNGDDESDSVLEACDKDLKVTDEEERSELDAVLQHPCSEEAQFKNTAGAAVITTIESPTSVTVAENSLAKEILYTVTATHEFTGSTEQELSFEKGTQILIFQEADEHWLMGRIGNSEGYIASAYVSTPVVVSKKDSAEIIGEGRLSSEKENADSDLQRNEGRVKSTRNLLTDKHHVYTAPAAQNVKARSDAKSAQLKPALAVHDYRARTDSDLSISAGDTVWVIRVVDDAWMQVKNESGRHGVVPASYVRFATDPGSQLPESAGEQQQNSFDQPFGNGSVKNNDALNSISQSCTANTSHYPIPVLSEDAHSITAHIDENEACKKQTAAFTLPKPSIPRKPENLPRDTVAANLQRKFAPVGSATLNHSRINANQLSSIVQQRDAARVKDTGSRLTEQGQSYVASVAGGLFSSQNERTMMLTDKSNRRPDEKSNFGRVAGGRSASVREKRSQKHDVSVDAVMEKLRQGTESEQNRRSSVGSGSGGKNSKTWRSDSVPTASTVLSSPHSDSRASHSVESELSNLDAVSTVSKKPTISKRTVRRPAPPVPSHQDQTTSSPKSLQSVPSPNAPLDSSVAARKRLPDVESERNVVDVSTSPDLVRGHVTRGNIVPARPAPGPPPRTLSSPRRKVPPMRPANPPKSRSPSKKVLDGGDKDQDASRELRDKIQKILSDIEDFNCMKRDLETLHQGTLDGKEQKEISENLEFVETNIERLQKEFHSLIDGQEEHIYEVIEQFTKPHLVPDRSNTFERLPAPPLPPSLESPSAVREKRKEKRLLVATELINTERDFLTNVTVTVDDIMKKLIDEEISSTTIATLFVNIVQVQEFSERLLGELEEALQNENSDQPDFGCKTIGQVFIDRNPEMKAVYMPYCRDHDDAMTLLEKLQDDAEFMHAVKTCLDSIKNKVNVFDLGSFLIKPVQRFLKYPLLIEELIKLTDASTPENPSDHDKLIAAHKLMQSVAKDINEDKRIKDLVRKYKDASNEGLTDKLGKISMKSFRKKSSRFSIKFGLATGISTSETRDAQFDELERRFRAMERAAKCFVQNITTYCDKCREVLCAELAVAQAMVTMVYECDRSHPVSIYRAAAEKMSGLLYKQFHNEIQNQVFSPVQSLLASFKSPHTIIDKRLDKLIDYDRLQKHSDSKEKIEAAKHDYEALNKSLLDELPKLCDLSARVLTSCSATFAKSHRDFNSKLLQELKPLLATIQDSDGGEPKICSGIETQDLFKPAYIEAVSTIAKLQVVPASFGSLYGSQKGSAETRRKSRAGQPESNSFSKQPPRDRAGLRKKYQARQIYVANRNYEALQPADLSCCEGDLVAVLKQQDPMGNSQKWFVDKGGAGLSTGFLPSVILNPYDSTQDESLVSLSPPTPKPRAPIPAPRTKSPTPSSRSTSSTDSGGGTVKSTLSPFMLREKFKAGSLQSKEGGSPLLQLTDSDVLGVFAEEDEIFDEVEYGFGSYAETSQRSSKQHFRAEYEFVARTKLELTVHAGNIVKLIMPHDTDGNSEWWLVSDADGRQGYVPASYLAEAKYLRPSHL